MKLNKSTILAFFLLIIVASLYRVWDGRPFGFAPQIAMAIFGGAMISDKRLAFILPLLSILISDIIYQGFYSGQWQMYILYAALTLFGFLMKKKNALNILGFSIGGSLLFFIISNFLVWAGGGGLGRPQTFEGLMLCYGDAIAFYRDYGLIHGFAGNILIGDLFFSGMLFGAYFLIYDKVLKP